MEPLEPGSIASERENHIAELEARLARPAPVGVSPWVALVGIAMSGWLLWQQRLDIFYFVSSTQPIELGTEGAYQFNDLQSNRYAQIHGIPTSRACYGKDGDRTFVVVGLRETPLIVRRGALPTENWLPGHTPPRPDQRSFTVRGRLLSERDSGKWLEAITTLRGFNEVHPTWILLEGERPGQNFGVMGWTTLLVFLLAVNGWMLVRFILVRLN